jgi:hypothetical protein
MSKNKGAVALGKLSAKKVKRTLGITNYKAEMVKRGKNGATARWKAHREKMSTASLQKA